MFRHRLYVFSKSTSSTLRHVTSWMSKKRTHDDNVDDAAPEQHAWTGGWLLLSTDCVRLPEEDGPFPETLESIKVCADAQCECIFGSFLLNGESDVEAETSVLHSPSWQCEELCDPISGQPFTLIQGELRVSTLSPRSGRLRMVGDEFAGIESISATLDLTEAAVVDRHGRPVLLGEFAFEVTFGRLYTERGFPASWSQSATYILIAHDALVG
jgi:hypothetical protein